MKASTSALLRATSGAAVLLVLSLSAQGQSTALPATSASPGGSRITQVKVYPGSATVDRVARIAAGSRSVTFACLPAGLDVQSLQVSADASVRVGETSVLSETRELSAQCATSALDGRIRELEDQKAALQAESDALGMVNGYLKGLAGGSGESGAGARAPADARNLVAVTEAMRRTGQDSLLKQHQIQRRQSDIDRQLNPLLAERTRAQGSGDKVMAVTVTLAASADATSSSATRSTAPAGRPPTARCSTAPRARSASSARRWWRRPRAKTGAA